MTPGRLAEIDRWVESGPDWAIEERLTMRTVLAEVDRLRAQIERIESVLEEGDHGLYCDSHYGNHCTCWNHKIAVITGYGYE